ncbi:flavin reductase family protein [Microbispora triticiradicis]|uniref:flavin reductase family protein n=1 Tax=Microbispora triticiradicis TaxID=2200763 RepID=UPI001AD7A46C|nr:flavin reductase family protein [Microbispora triticiradicis]MBO4270662.1 NADH:riboflavin 5'-phosphate oxidoreductase [Microbispora triticiradicis]
MQVESLIDAGAFRQAMAELVAPLTIVTTVDENGRRWGFTASSVTSGSLEPPLLLVGVDRRSSCHEAITSCREFVVNVLGEQHRDLARTFATHGVDRFAGGELGFWPDSELPCLLDAKAAFRCVSSGTLAVGDHDLLVGSMVATRLNVGGTPLLWYQRDFALPAREAGVVREPV